MKYFDTFTGIGAGSLAVQSIFPNAECVGFSEIDKYAEAVYKFHYPEHKNYGDISKIDIQSLPDFDLLIGGFPCQPFSIAGARKGFEDERGQMIYYLLKILKIKQPKYFIFENVASMKKSDKDKLSELIGFEPVVINSALVSAQSRKRLFWVGRLVNGVYEKVEIDQPKDKGILLKDILEEGVVDRDKSYCMDASYYKGANWDQYKTKGRRQLVQKVGQLSSGGQGDRIYSTEGKSVTLSANSGGKGSKTGLYAMAKRGRYNQDGKTEQKFETSFNEKANSLTLVQKDSLVYNPPIIRKLTPTEGERLQTFPDNYTAQGLFNGGIKPISNTQRYKQLGNSFTVEVIKHILTFLS